MDKREGKGMEEKGKEREERNYLGRRREIPRDRRREREGKIGREERKRWKGKG